MKVLVEARKSRGVALGGPALEDGLEPNNREGGLIEPSELDPGLDLCVPLEVGRTGLSALKKLEALLRTAGEEGIFCRVSIVRSDKDGRGFRLMLALNGSPSSTGRVPSPCAKSCSSPESGRMNSCRRAAFEDFLKSASSLGFLKTWLFCLYSPVPVETSRSRVCEGESCGFLVDVPDSRGFKELEADNCSRDGAGRRRGLLMLCLAACCRFSLEGAGRRVELGTGSLEVLEGRGMREGFVAG